MTSKTGARDLAGFVGGNKPDATARRTLLVAGLAHALHDGFTDLIYVMLPVWQTEFGLSYAALAVLRGLYAGAMAALQVPSGFLTRRFGGRAILALGTAMAAAGYTLAGLSGGLIGVCIALFMSGAGSSTQHPIGSAAVARAYGTNARGPLGTYNFSGDLGKAAVPAAVSVLMLIMSWRGTLISISLVGFAVAAIVAIFMPPIGRPVAEPPAKTGQGRGGFGLLFSIGVLDTGVRMGLLTFLPFLLRDKGAELPTIGLALALVFVGGAAGKIICGPLGARFGVVATTIATEGATALAILSLLVLPLTASMVMLPVLGAMLNGTSSVLYGTVPELAKPGKTEHAFALFYTGTIGAGAIAPVLYGFMGDAIGVRWATVAIAATAIAIFPIVMLLAPRLAPK
ncbi:MAG: MFS transporter [Bradyrhizobiaceae bacterium]|nr:MAG: MFS transporter [Bradyrhizobiaceae bacterium]